MISFGKFFDGLNQVHSFHDFVLLFNSLSQPMQIFVGAVIFGCLVLVYIFFVAIFIDKHI